MSYDIWLEEIPEAWVGGDPADTALRTFRWLTPTSVTFPAMRAEPFPGETSTDIGNYTSNVSGMWHKALGCQLRDLAGKRSGEQVELLAAALAAMEMNAEEFRSMNPPNGWGDFEGAHDYLFKLLVGCLRHPEATILISA